MCRPPALLLGLTLLTGTGYAAPVDFVRDVRPILESRCFRCHGPKRQEGGLRLDVRKNALAGGDSGPVLTRGGHGRVELDHRIASAEETTRMPPDRPLPTAELALLRAWIAQGAAWPDGATGSDGATEHWAFRPVRRPGAPKVKDTAWVRNSIDAFVLARLEAKGVRPSPETDRATLLRRLHLDLLGLPPTPADVDDFLKDDHPGAYEKVVDRLLASPHFGERWGRHWLDLARFAESDGYENDRIRPDAWRYRDWVIDAINADKPFDRFTVEQLAGDLLPDPTAEQRTATGLHRNTLWNSAASADKEEFRTLAIKDRTDTTAAAWMGLTLGCARCHSHKYDPVSQREYYRLYAFFNNTDDDDVSVPGGKVQALKAVRRTTHAHQRGNFLNKGDEVRPGTPAFLPPLTARGPEADRLDLARWLVDPAHPLTARVAVNHVWQHLFGEGIVRTPENFGASGSPPTHPELLDWLAAEFVRLKWSRKQLVRTVLLSAVYRQASRHRLELAASDPDNSLLARQNRFRVEAEIVRDAALAVSGLLDAKRGGPSVVPPFPKELPTGQFTNEALKRPTKEWQRRGVYVHVQRTLPHPTLSAFDAADGNQPCPRRVRSTTPIQALTLLNDPTFLESARALGTRLREAGSSRETRIAAAFRLCLGRGPTDAEASVVVELVEKQRQLKAGDEAVWAGVARMMLNLEEFTTRE
jgi:hypothetical protein